MTLKPKLLSLIGMVALVLTSFGLSAGPTIAQSSTQTTITVENSECVDDTPTSISMSPEALQFPARDPQNPAHSTRGAVNLNIVMYVNTCLGQGWTVTATATDFHSGTNSFSAATHLGYQGDSFAAGRVTSDGYMTEPGTTGTTWGSWLAFTSTAPNLSTSSLPISTGTTESSGNMYQGLQFRLLSLPATIPGGNYQATLTLTFASDGP